MHFLLFSGSNIARKSHTVTILSYQIMLTTIQSFNHNSKISQSSTHTVQHLLITPPSPYSQPFSTFLNQRLSFLSHAATTPHEFIITVDFNIHVDDLINTQTIQFVYLLASCNLTQHVKIPTHRCMVTPSILS